MAEVFHIDREQAGDLALALALLDEACRGAGVEFFVVGAAARDLLLLHVYGVRPFRATGDIDVAVAVQGWGEYDAVLDRLKNDHHFERGPEPHRVKRGGLTVDLVPFGKIAHGESEVEWPGEERTMSVLGYPEAFEAAVGIQIGDADPVRVASLAGVVVLKLVAWSGSPVRRKQDPVDVCAIMTTYSEVVGEDLYHRHDDLLAEDPFDLRVVSSRILGRDVAPLLRDAGLRALVLDVLRGNTTHDDQSRFAEAMGSECLPDFPVRLRCLRSLRVGVEESLPGAEGVAG